MNRVIKNCLVQAAASGSRGCLRCVSACGSPWLLGGVVACGSPWLRGLSGYSWLAVDVLFEWLCVVAHSLLR